MQRPVRNFVRPVLGALSALFFATTAFAQSTVLQGGPWVPGHAPMYVGQGSAQPILQDSGASSGGPLGSTLSELGITSRSSTSTYPSTNSGNGPYYSHFCMYDAPTTNTTGFHYLCLDPNSLNGGLLSYGAAGGAAQLPLQFNVNGETYTFPFGGGGGGGTVGLWSDAVNPTATNTFPQISQSYTSGASGAATLIVNGVSYSDHASAPVFSVFGKTIIWNASNAGFNVGPGDTASITYTGFGGSPTAGTVSSVAATVPSFMSVSGSPITTVGTLAFGLTFQNANTVFAGPSSGSPTTPTFRSLGLTDLPSIAANTVLGATASASPSALSVPSCSAAASALTWTTGTGFGCNTINTNSPGGSTGQLQYNNAGAFAGTATGTGVLTALGVNPGTAGSFVVNGGVLGTPSSGTLTNTTGLPISTGLTGAGTGVITALGNATNATGGLVTFSGALGTPTSGTLTNTTGLPISTGLTGAGTGVLTALGVNTGSAGAFVVNGGVLGTPSSGTLTNATGLPVSTGLTGAGTGVITALGNATNGSGGLVTYSGALGTPTSGTLTNATGLPISTGLTGAGTGVLTALGVNTGSAGSFVVNGGALGTPSSGTLTNATGLPISTGVSGLGTGIATALAVNTGTAGAPVINGGALGTPSSGTLTNATGLVLTSGTGVTGTLPVANGGTGAGTFTSNAPLIGAGTSAISVGSRSGSTTTFATSNGTLTNGHCVSIDASGNFVDAGGACTTGGGGGTVSSGTVGQITYYASTGTTVSGATTGTGVLTALGVNTGTAGAFVVNGGALGTPSSGTLTNATGLPVSTGLSGAGTGVVTALGNATNGSGGLVTYSGALGTPTSGVLTNATGLVLTSGTGVTGTLPVANGGTGATTLTGVLKGNGTSAFTAATAGTDYLAPPSGTAILKANSGGALANATAGTDYVAPGTATSFTATQTLSGSSSTLATILTNAAETVDVIASAPSSTTNFYLNNGAVQLYTSNATANWTLNLAFSSGTSLNTALATGQSVTFAMLATQGTTAYYQSAMTIDGTSVTPKWQGGSAPSAGDASSIDVYECTAIKTASATYTVLCSQTQFK